MLNSDKQFLNKLIQIIEENLENKALDASFLEEHLVMSRMKIYRKLKSLSQMAPGEFIRYIRLNKTGNLLQTTELSVSEIFCRSGFNNRSYFFREFKRQYKCSPNQYRLQPNLHTGFYDGQVSLFHGV